MTTIRPLASADRAAWDPLWEGYLDFYETDLAPSVTESTWSRLLDPAEPVQGLVAVVDGEVVGFAHHLLHRSTWSPTWYGYLEDLFVAPTARSRGIGRELVEATAAAVAAAGATKLYWQTHRDNATARALYDRLARHDGFLVYERDLG